MNNMTLMAAIASACLMVGAHAQAAQPKIAVTAAAAPASQGAPMSRSERQLLTDQIARKWGTYVKTVRNTSPSVWRQSMAAAFRSADPGNLRRAAKMETYEGMIGVLLGHNTTDAQVINAFATSKAPLHIMAQTLGSPAADLVYNVLTPCRILDTRVAGGIVANLSTRDFIAYNPGGNFAAQGGSASSDCGVPAYAAAVVVNITDTLPNLNNFITIWPYGETMPLAATILGVKNGYVSNETVIKVTQGGAYHFSAYAFGQAHLVGDVVGYFSAPEATALDCVQANAVSPQVAAGTSYSLAATCPVGYGVTGGGVFVTGTNTNASDWTIGESYAKLPDKWQAAGKNNGIDADTVQVRAVCCRVPGH